MFNYDEFYRTHGPDVHVDPVRFIKTSNLCRGSVLDVGCGTGTLADYYKKDYLGIDISKVAIDFAKEKRRETANFFCSDLSDFILSSKKKYDTVVFAEILEHISDDSFIFDNIEKITHSNSRIIVSVPNGNKIPDESHLRQFTIPELRKKFKKLGRVKFYNWPGAKRRILMTCDLGEFNEDLISLVIPAKNEGLGLENAILSCIGFVDNIVISVDDSSFDNTLEVAKRYADTLKTYKWEDSFAKARNFAQEGVKTKWVLALDGHEFVKSSDGIIKALSRGVDGFEVPIVLENGFKFNFPRIVRNNIKWGADVHNYPIIKSRDFVPSFIIVHDRDGSQSKEATAIRDKQRKEMITDIMGKEKKEDKNASRPYFYLAQQNFFSKNYIKAIKSYKSYLKRSKHKGERWLVYYNMAQCYSFVNKYFSALRSLDKADKEIPGRWEISKLRGMMLTLNKNYEEAVVHLVESFNKQTGNFTYCPEERDDAKTWNVIGHCLTMIQKPLEAKEAYKRFLELEKLKPEDKQDKISIQVIEKALTI